MSNLWTSVQKDSNIQFKYQMSKVQEQEFRKDSTTSEPFKKGNLMGKLIDETFAKQLLSDLDRIKELLVDIKGPEQEDVKKEQRKLWQILADARDVFYYEKPKEFLATTESFFTALVPAAIDAVIECFDEWINNCQQPRPFPEYLKEKML